MDVYTLAYHSLSRLDARVADPRVELDRILSAARTRNDSNGVTGALLFGERRFVQILEGPPASVKTTFEMIRYDERHKAVTVLSTGFRNVRRFSSWSMAFAGTSPSASAYFASFAPKGDQDWRELSDSALGHLMLKMIDLEEGAAAGPA